MSVMCVLRANTGIVSIKAGVRSGLAHQKLFGG
jgi:hypothetical protein